jgi:hypothetical protein
MLNKTLSHEIQLFKDDPPGPDPKPDIPDCNETAIPRNICKTYDWLVDNVVVWDDHIMINDSFPILRTDYFTSRLNDLDHFYGFSPRWIIPQARMVNATDIERKKVAT